MLQSSIDYKKDQEFIETSTPEADIGDALSGKEQNESDKDNENSMPSAKQEEEVIKKKYGGMIPKKVPLISKDHERAFFDSADWALGKDGAQKPKGPLEALRPKLLPTPHHQARSRRFASAPSNADGGEDMDETGLNESLNDRDNADNTSKDAQNDDN